MGSPSHTFTHGTFDQQAAEIVFSQDGFLEALAGCANLLGLCLILSPKDPEFANALHGVCTILENDEWPFGSNDAVRRACELISPACGDSANAQEAEGLTAAYTRLFRGPAKLPAPPWGSVYMDRDQVLYGWTWVELRNWMRAHGIQGTYDENDPEDHFARMLLLCSFLANEKPELLCEFLADHLLCWSERFLALLQEASATLSYPVYEGLAVLAATTLDDIGELLGIQPAARRMHR